jgi:hypothetical protein
LFSKSLNEPYYYFIFYTFYSSELKRKKKPKLFPCTKTNITLRTRKPAIIETKCLAFSFKTNLPYTRSKLTKHNEATAYRKNFTSEYNVGYGRAKRKTYKYIFFSYCILNDHCFPYIDKRSKRKQNLFIGGKTKETRLLSV